MEEKQSSPMIPMDNNDNNHKTMDEQQSKKVDGETVNKRHLCIYFVVLLIPFVTLLTLVLTSILNYSRWPIYTETNIVPQNEANFPAITFCSSHDGYKENVLRVSIVFHQ